LLVAGDDVVGSANDAVRLDRRAGPADIVDPEQDPTCETARLTQRVASKRATRSRAPSLSARLPLMPQFSTAMAGPASSTGVGTWPAPVGIDGGIRPVGDQSPKILIARVGARLDQDSGQKETMGEPINDPKCSAAVKSPGVDISHLQTDLMNRQALSPANRD
jgi:hypothetical protein